MDSQRPRIPLISVGGTMSLYAPSRLDLAAYHVTGERRPMSDLVDSVPEINSIADVEPIDFRSTSSTSLSPDDWIELHGLLESLLDTVDGVVIAHGTNTLEETALFLDLCVDSPTPVVVVGAMRPPSALSSDAPLNLVRAAQVAASRAARGHGVLVAIDDLIYLARDVVKVASHGLRAFDAPNSGPIGSVDPEGRVVLDRRRERARIRFDLSSVSGLPRVDIVVSHVGADGSLIDAAIAAGTRGIVCAGAGAGRPTPLELEALERAVDKGVVVCLSSRVSSATVPQTPDTVASGLVVSRDLNPWKARVLLSLALTRTDDPDQVQALFDQV